MVNHAIGEMNKWIAAHGGNLRNVIGSLEYPAMEYPQAEDEVEDGVEEEMDEWLGDDDEDAIEL